MNKKEIDIIKEDNKEVLERAIYDKYIISVVKNRANNCKYQAALHKKKMLEIEKIRPVQRKAMNNPMGPAKSPLPSFEDIRYTIIKDLMNKTRGKKSKMQVKSKAIIQEELNELQLKYNKLLNSPLIN